MIITTAKANVSLSKNINGAWKRLEVGAEATLEPGENWQQAERRLYAEVASEFRVLWGANGLSPEHAPDSTETAVQEPVGLTAPDVGDNPADQQVPSDSDGQQYNSGVPRDHWCAQHGVQFQERQKGRRIWYSHRVGSSGWCNEATN